jgi:hypothetical protein
MRCKLSAALLLAAAMAFCGPAYAQADSSVETVVVTGMRAGNDEGAPYVTITQRADHLVTKVRVVCDTRDPGKREEELRQTLLNMIAEARRGQSISLSVGDDILVDFTDKMLDKVIVPDTKADTSDAYVVIKTDLGRTDTFDGATQRIKDYVDRTAKVGRTEILMNESFNLGLVKPERYRDALLAKIAEDAKQTAAVFGPGFSVSLEGLERRISWFQSGPLDLSLYISYNMTVAPLPAH